MKNLRILWAIITGSVLFTAGLMISPGYPVTRAIFIATGVLAVLFFYIKTLLDVIHSPTISQSRRVFWLIVVVCVPIMGNLAYVIIHYTLIKKQVPHGTW